MLGSVGIAGSFKNPRWRARVPSAPGRGISKWGTSDRAIPPRVAVSRPTACRWGAGGASSPSTARSFQIRSSGKGTTLFTDHRSVFDRHEVPSKDRGAFLAGRRRKGNHTRSTSAGRRLPLVWFPRTAFTRINRTRLAFA